MADEKPVLGADDYAMLSDMLMSSDAAVRARGMEISKKLTAPEQQAFFDYQKSARPSNQTDEYARTDRNVIGWNGGGIDPEVAVAGGLGAARAFGGPAASTGLRLVQGAKNLVTQAAPLVKYEATKTILQKMGVPESIATVSAAAVSGYKPGKASVAVEPAAPSALEAAPPAAKAPSLEVSPPTVTAVEKAKLTSAETPVYIRLRAQGKTHAQAMEAIGASRNLAPSSSFANLPTSIDVAKAVGDRNAGGSW